MIENIKAETFIQILLIETRVIRRHNRQYLFLWGEDGSVHPFEGNCSVWIGLCCRVGESRIVSLA